MIVNKEKLRFGCTDILIVVASLFYVIGIKSIFPVCASMDGSYMACHWAGETLYALSLLGAFLALIHLITAEGLVKTGIDISVAGIWLVAANIPGRIINICQMESMSCRSRTLPWTLGVGIALIILCVLDALVYASLRSKEKHKRK